MTNRNRIYGLLIGSVGIRQRSPIVRRKHEVVNPATYNEGTMGLPWEVCFFCGGGGMREYRNKIVETEVSRVHSSEETPVRGVERRAESLKQGLLI